MYLHIFYTHNFPVTCSYWKSKLVCKNISTGRQSLTSAYTDKKENQIFLIYKEIKTGAVSKSYMRKGFLIYEEMLKYFPIYEEAVSHICMTLQLFHSEFPYDENLIFFFISVTSKNNILS
jgi:hypothetical protein